VFYESTLWASENTGIPSADRGSNLKPQRYGLTNSSADSCHGFAFEGPTERFWSDDHSEWLDFRFNHKPRARGTNPLLGSKQDEQQARRAASKTTSVPDPSPLVAMMIGLLGLDPLRNPLLTEEFRQSH
jgi:hypothetical protein